ncbi:hypothetical protein BD311DRAFT_715762 [Dichomitus squalens]|uniref:Uncharacterized protein n=1 Tax=Dichomitus squalens TaxID=114155 RepID=A0A4Q9MWH9_9APHY|nr:hypothetical protein BD311DRAFT_715762 [Dichomitus squalens]
MFGLRELFKSLSISRTIHVPHLPIPRILHPFASIRQPLGDETETASRTRMRAIRAEGGIVKDLDESRKAFKKVVCGRETVKAAGGEYGKGNAVSSAAPLPYRPHRVPHWTIAQQSPSLSISQAMAQLRIRRQDGFTASSKLQTGLKNGQGPMEDIIPAPLEEAMEEILPAPLEECMEDVVATPLEDAMEDVIPAPLEEQMEEVLPAPLVYAPPMSHFFWTLVNQPAVPPQTPRMNRTRDREAFTPASPLAGKSRASLSRIAVLPLTPFPETPVKPRRRRRLMSAGSPY